MILFKVNWRGIKLAHEFAIRNLKSKGLVRHQHSCEYCHKDWDCKQDHGHKKMQIRGVDSYAVDYKPWRCPEHMVNH